MGRAVHLANTGLLTTKKKKNEEGHIIKNICSVCFWAKQLRRATLASLVTHESLVMLKLMQPLAPKLRFPAWNLRGKVIHSQGDHLWLDEG